jgi:hypothetical protein
MHPNQQIIKYALIVAIAISFIFAAAFAVIKLS